MLLCIYVYGKYLHENKKVHVKISYSEDYDTPYKFSIITFMS